jgi:hypothetical protein
MQKELGFALLCAPFHFMRSFQAFESKKCTDAVAEVEAFVFDSNERFHPSECRDECEAKRRAKQKSYPRRN